MSKTVTGSGRARIGEDVVDLKFTVPEGPCPPEAVLPEAQKLADQMAALGARRVRAAGLNISCAKGCGACCRQMVPISPTEARHLAALVASLPAERAAEMRRRFEAARARMDSALLPPRGHPHHDKSAYREFGLAYFRLGIACPFLQDESCSIHAARPLVCREYQVTSPPAACAELGSGAVRQVPVPAAIWAAFGRSVSENGDLEWMPLVEALRHAAAHPEPQPQRTGPEHVQRLLQSLQR